MSNFFGHYAEFGLILFLCMKWVLFFKPFYSIIDWDSVQNNLIFGTCSFIKTIYIFDTWTWWSAPT